MISVRLLKMKHSGRKQNEFHKLKSLNFDSVVMPSFSLNKHMRVWNSANKPTQPRQKFTLPLRNLQFSVAVNVSFRENIFFNTNVISELFSKLSFYY